MVTIPLRGSTIPQQITVKKGATIVLIKPAREGTGVIAAGGMRAILELGGVKDVVGKSLGSRNPINIVYATMEALRQLKDPATELAKRGIRPLPAPATPEGEGATATAVAS
jgi:small subunit ribosomal protein S5